MERISSEYEELKVEKAKLEVALKTVGEQLERERREYQEKINELQSHISLLRSQRESLSKELKQLRETHRNQPKPQKVKRDKPRVGVFVDVQNMFYAARENYNGKLDYAKLLDVVVRDRILVTANAYVVYNPEIDQSSFLSFLEYQGYKVKSKNLTVRSDGSAKGNWDVGMTIDIISMIDELDVVAIVSGDGDFCPLVEMLRKNGITVEVYGFERNTSMELKGLADEFYPISGDMVIID
ncbi:TPA: NYN domain-containing protein [Candidatus Poribacteria bacterium]|nr:NYN domain-containing protein [Candidatus Poribacteria bacterium]